MDPIIIQPEYKLSNHPLSDEEVYDILKLRKVTLRQDFHMHLAGIIKAIVFKRKFEISSLDNILNWTEKLWEMQPQKISHLLIIRYLLKL